MRQTPLHRRTHKHVMKYRMWCRNMRVIALPAEVLSFPCCCVCPNPKEAVLGSEYKHIRVYGLIDFAVVWHSRKHVLILYCQMLKKNTGGFVGVSWWWCNLVWYWRLNFHVSIIYQKVQNALFHMAWVKKISASVVKGYFVEPQAQKQTYLWNMKYRYLTSGVQCSFQVSVREWEC